MLLTIDIGNTNTVLGVFEGEQVVEHWRIATDPVRTADELAVVLQGLLALASVSGVLAAVRGAPAALGLLALLGVAVPLVYGVSWVIASAARRTPLSLMLTGREYASARRRAGGANGTG